MAHPKSRGSKQRKHKRRTHFKTVAANVATCKTTGEKHLMHRAYFDLEGNMMYRGKVLIAAEQPQEETQQ
jgi:large subunit ribosomal protein L32